MVHCREPLDWVEAGQRDEALLVARSGEQGDLRALGSFALDEVHVKGVDKQVCTLVSCEV